MPNCSDLTFLKRSALHETQRERSKSRGKRNLLTGRGLCKAQPAAKIGHSPLKLKGTTRPISAKFTTQCRPTIPPGKGGGEGGLELNLVCGYKDGQDPALPPRCSQSKNQLNLRGKKYLKSLMGRLSIPIAGNFPAALEVAATTFSQPKGGRAAAIWTLHKLYKLNHFSCDRGGGGGDSY